MVSSVNSTISPTKLTVAEISDLPSILVIANEWAELATKRFFEAQSIQNSKPSLFDADTIDRLEDSMIITRAIFERITNRMRESSSYIAWNQVLVCQDQNSKIHAIGLVDTEDNSLLRLATNPDNIPSTLNDKQIIRGSGTQIILHLAQVALKTKMDIQLGITESSKPFYEKLGFTLVKGWDYKLTVSKINELVAQKKPPFEQLKND